MTQILKTTIYSHPSTHRSMARMNPTRNVISQQIVIVQSRSGGSHTFFPHDGQGLGALTSRGGDTCRRRSTRWPGAQFSTATTYTRRYGQSESTGRVLTRDCSTETTAHGGVRPDGGVQELVSNFAEFDAPSSQSMPQACPTKFDDLPRCS